MPGLKVLLISNKVPYPANDGSSIAIGSMVDALMQNGAEVSLLSINTSKHFKNDEEIAAKKPENLHFHKIDANTSITALGAFFNLISGEPYHVSRFKIRDFETRLINLLQQQDFDIVQIEGLSMAVYREVIRKNSKAKIVLRAHNVEYEIWERHIANEGNFLKRFYLKLQVGRLEKFERATLGKMDAVLAITSDDLGILQQIAPQVKMTVIPCGIDIENFPVCSSRNTPQTDIACLASFDWLPNVQGTEWFVREVWPIVKENLPYITFTLGGRHMPKGFLKFRESGISIHTDVPEMRDFICSARLIIVPLLAGSGMRIKIIENMAMGKCQVTTTIGAEGILAESGKNILIADEPQAFAEAIIRALNDRALSKNIETAARKTIEENYSNKDLGSHLMHFYTSVL